jgi:5-hydroxyisourate hydrolase-like protein (transthyretin family)
METFEIVSLLYANAVPRLSRAMGDGHLTVHVLDTARGVGAEGMEVSLEVEAYFTAHGVPTGDPSDLTQVPVQVTLGPGVQRHLPLAITPWGYTTFRGER